ncbi:MAG TPA: non-homologous end-joining DNA ligase [Gemmatimonadales bacterium]|nr:non-homologous end-joining DNA ligase [Gemmatimonadales bacterium]
MALIDQPPPRWLPPMLATLSEDATAPAHWPVEPKWDGVRVLAVLHPDDGLRLWSRNETDFTLTFPDVVAELAERARGYGILDGEVVAGAPGSMGDFGRLLKRLGRRLPMPERVTGVPVAYHVFDVLWWEGRDRRGLPWTARRELLARTLDFGGRVRQTPAWTSRRAERLANLCATGGEGLIAKRPDAPYQSTRSRDWLKLKCERQGDFVVGGWTAPSGMRTGLGALLVGTWEDGELRYVGRVGTGFTEPELDRTAARLADLARPRSPFVDPPRRPAARWCAPVLTCRVRYTEWTDDGKLRHPSFRGWVGD